MSEEKRIIVTDKSSLGHLVNLLDNSKPVGWSRKSYAPYYKKMYADWLKKDIDKMIVHRGAIHYDIRKFPDIKLQALYNRVNQALRFLLEPRNGMDKDGVYAAWYETIYVRRTTIGVKIFFDSILEGTAQADVLKGEELAPKWRRALDIYLESDNPNGKPFYQGSLVLTDEEVTELEESLSGLTNVIFSINNREVKVVKSSV